MIKSYLKYHKYPEVFISGIILTILEFIIIAIIMSQISVICTILLWMTYRLIESYQDIKIINRVINNVNEQTN